MKKRPTNHMKQFYKIIIFIGCISSFSTNAQIGSVLWQENFNTLDTTVWNVITGDGTGTPAGAGWGNSELEYYKSSNVYIADVPGETGNKALVLEAKSETAGTRSFTSGKIESYGKLSVKYGVIEIRARIPDLKTGLWPALWMLGTANAGWPSKGEIDIAEMGHNLAERTRQGFPNSNVNNYLGSNLIFYSSSAVSTSNPSGAASIAYDVNYDSPYVAPTALTDRFLTYRMYWSSTSIRFTVIDGTTEIDLYTAPFSMSSESEEFNNPFYFLMNLAVGGTFTDATTNGQVNAPLPAKMYVDYIKVSQWNGEGTVSQGGPTAQTGTFGVYTDNSATTNKLTIGSDADIYAWNNFTAGTTAPYEGSNAIAWQTATANTWFGGGIAARQPVNLSNFTSGNLKFRIKIPANVNFKIGVTDNYTNEKYISFPANTTKYGLVRDGNWGLVTIPVSDLTGTIALQSMNYLFTIVSDGTLPISTFQFAIDDVYYEGGGGATTVAVTSVAVSPSIASISTGGSIQLTGSISPSTATNQAKTWSSSNTAVATVSASGLVTGVAAGSATITVTTSDGSKIATCAVSVTTSNTIPAPWVTSDIGAVGAVGSASYASGDFTVVGSGADIWNTADEFRYVYQSLTGDGEIVAKVTSLTNTNVWAKAGVMFRETLDAGAVNAAMIVSASEGVSYQRRTTTNGSSDYNGVSGQTAPKWLKMKRASNVFSAYYSADGITWTQLGSNTTIAMASTIYVGLCVTSHVNATLCTASINNVSVTATTSTVAVTGVSMSPITASLATGATQQLTATIAPTNATTKTVSWSSSNTSVATVSSSGLVTAVGTGTTTITATTTSASKTATCVINVTAPTCTASATTGDYTVQVSASTSNPTLTFIPSRTNVGATTCILYYGTSATAALPGYRVTANTPYTIAAASGTKIYFYYTYSLPEGGENNTAAHKHNFTVGTCSSLSTAKNLITTKSFIGDIEETSGKLAIYPNPSSSEINILNGDPKSAYTVLTINGKIVLEGIGNNVDISKLAIGIYFIKINEDVLRFIKN